MGNCWSWCSDKSYNKNKTQHRKETSVYLIGLTKGKIVLGQNCFRQSS